MSVMKAQAIGPAWLNSHAGPIADVVCIASFEQIRQGNDLGSVAAVLRVPILGVVSHEKKRSGWW